MAKKNELVLLTSNVKADKPSFTPESIPSHLVYFAVCAVVIGCGFCHFQVVGECADLNSELIDCTIALGEAEQGWTKCSQSLGVVTNELRACQKKVFYFNTFIFPALFVSLILNGTLAFICFFLYHTGGRWGQQDLRLIVVLLALIVFVLIAGGGVSAFA